MLKHTDKKTKKHTWVLENDNGNKIIKDYDKNGQIFQNFYIDYIKKGVKAYDVTVLYIYLLEKYCLLQNRVYISEANIININNETEISLNYYYETILDYIHDKKSNPIFIPSSFFWETTNFNDENIIKKKQLNQNKKKFIYLNRIQAIEKSRENLLLGCQDFYDQITPNVSKKAFIEQCNKIINKEETIITPYSLGTTINIIYEDVEKYDFDNTNNFNYNMNKLVKEVVYDMIDKEDDKKIYFEWIVFKNDSSFYNALADGLNRQLELTKSTTTNNYTEEIKGKRIFTKKTLEDLVNDTNIPSINKSIKKLEIRLGIKFIIFEMFKRDENDVINIGDIVLYKITNYRVIAINNPTAGTVTYDLYNGFYTLSNIPNDDITVTENVEDPATGIITNNTTQIKSIQKDISYNHLEKFRVYCDTISASDFDNYEDYMYFVVTKFQYNGKTETKVQLVRDIDNDYIVKKDQIPIYIKYLIFNSCPEIRSDTLFNDIDTKIDSVITLDVTNTNDLAITLDNIKKEIDNIDKKLDEKYKIRKYIRDIIAENIKKNERSEESKNSIKMELISNEIDYLEKQLLQLRKIKNETDPRTRTKITGGNPDITFYPYQGYNQGYNPNQGYNQGYNPYQGYNKQMSRYDRTQNNIMQNKAKDQKSKLTFYIEVELELFPGTSANVFQKSVIKCQSTFERIREAWADISGFEYRPSPMNEAYAYNITNDEEQRNQRKEQKKQRKQRKQQNKTLKNNIRNNNKTLKNKSQ